MSWFNTFLPGGYGMAMLDLLGGGIGRGLLSGAYGLYGEPGAGKTSLTHIIEASTLRQLQLWHKAHNGPDQAQHAAFKNLFPFLDPGKFYGVVHLDAEGRYDPLWAKRLGMPALPDTPDKDHPVWFRKVAVNDMLDWFATMEALATDKTMGAVLYTWDSLDMTQTPTERAAKLGDDGEKVADRAKLLSSKINRLQELLQDTFSTLLMVLQVREGGVGNARYYGPKYITGGGYKKEHLFWGKWYLRKGKSASDSTTDSLTGIEVTKHFIEAKKNTGSPLDEVNFHLVSKSKGNTVGYDVYWDRVYAALFLGLFTNKNGEVIGSRRDTGQVISGTHVFEGQELGAGAEAVHDTLKADRDLFRKLEYAIWQAAGWRR